MAHVPRLYVPRAAPGRLVLDTDQSRRLSAVMRLREGDSLLVFAGDGCEWQARVAGVVRNAVHVEVGELARQEPAAPLTIEVWCGLVRANRFDWAIEKCTEAGADIIRPLISEHAARGEAASAGRMERWTRIVIEAAEQCGRLRLPVVESPAHLDKLLHLLHCPLLVADHEGMSWSEAAPLLPPEGRIAVAVGPEGGFSPTERAAARARGALAVSLGPNILRTETAAVVAVASLRARQG